MREPVATGVAMNADEEAALDFAAIDDSPLREIEIKHVRLLLERERARRRYVRKMRRYAFWLGVGTPTLLALQQFGIVDLIAGLIVRWRH